MMEQKILASLCLLAVLAAPGRAVEPAPAAPDSCSAELGRFCAPVEVSTAPAPSTWDCLDAHLNELSPECRRLCDEVLERADPCTAEKERFCPGVTRQGGARNKCMLANKEKLSAACRRHAEGGSARWAAASQRLKENMGRPYLQACAADRPKFCPGLLPLSVELLPCLSKHMQELSPRCRAAFPSL